MTTGREGPFRQSRREIDQQFLGPRDRVLAAGFALLPTMPATSRGSPRESRFLVALFPSGDLLLCAKHLFVEARTGAGCGNRAARATDDQLR